jgi:hypothetical protein
MRCLLLTVTRNRRGEAVRDGRVISAETLNIGRNSASEIHLPDARVRLHHATLTQTSERRLVLEVHGDPVLLDGKEVRSAHLRPGMTFRIGPYNCEVELPIPEGFEPHDFALSVEREDIKPKADKAIKRRPMSLKEAGFSPWAAGVLAAIVALICLIVIPRMDDFSSRAATLGANAPAVIALKNGWTAGPLAAGHRSFGNDCKACHTDPFQPVADSRCIACHASATPHIANIALRVSGKEERCASCHRDHRGLNGMLEQSPTLCADCHANIHANYPKSTLANAGDFADVHPAFRLSVMQAGAKQIETVAQTGKTQQLAYLGLKFPHDVHLAARGVAAPEIKTGQQTVTDAKGTRVVMHCADCHVPSPTGVGFEPVSMKDNCSQCHRLEFQPGNARQVPHAQPAEVMATLRDFYAAAALGTEPIVASSSAGIEKVVISASTAKPLGVNPGKTAAEASRATELAARDIFTVRVCVTCHTVNPTGDAAVPYAIAPVAGVQHWMPDSHFEHSAHAAVGCAECHPVSRVHDADVIAMPTIETCRTCHAGNKPVAGKVTSGCALCHDYHMHPDSKTTLAENAAGVLPAKEMAGPKATGARSNALVEESH